MTKFAITVFNIFVKMKHVFLFSLFTFLFLLYFISVYIWDFPLKQISRSLTWGHEKNCEVFWEIICLSLQVGTLRKEVADLGQVMKRMAQLMETLIPSVQPPTIVCPAHYSPAHHMCLRPATPTRSCPSPSPSKTASIWTEAPMPLTSPSLAAAQQHSVMCHTDFLIHRPQSLQAACPAMPSSASPLTPDSYQLQPASVISELPMPSSSCSLHDIPCCEVQAPTPIMSSVDSSPPQDGGQRGLYHSSGSSPQTGLGLVHRCPNQGL